MPPRNDRPDRKAGTATRPVNKKATIRRLLRYMMKFRWALLPALILTVISNALALVGPRLAGDAVNLIAGEGSAAAQGGMDLNGVVRLCLQMLLVYALSSFLSYILSLLMVWIGRSVTRRMRKDLFERLADMPVSRLDRRPIGDLISRIFYDTDTINTSLSSDLVNILASTVSITGSFAMMLSICAPLTLIFLVTIPLSIVLTAFITGKTQPLFRLRSRKMGELNDFSEERISGLTTLKAYCREDDTLSQLDRLNDEVCDSYYRSEYYSSTMGPSVNLINNLTLVLISVFSALMYISGNIDLGSISAFVQYSRKFSGPIREIADLYGELQSAIAAADRVFQLLDEPIEPEDPLDARILTDPRGNVEMEHVSFGYLPGKTILHDLSFQAESGKMIAVVGPTGAGKTTLINLLMRFYDIDSGQIRVDGTDIQKLTRSSLRRAYSMVLQDTWLFSGTVYDNIAYGRPEATREEVIEAAKAAHIHNYIMSLKDGYDTLITDDGANISKGQKQLLTIARGMLVNANMLILDEATSNVDTRTEIHIQEAMRRLMKNKTCFVVAHRLSTIRNADLILVVRNGDVVERGTHNELIQMNGFYRELYEAQFS